MGYEITVRDVDPQPVMGMRITTRRGDLSKAIMKGLDAAFGVVRAEAASGVGQPVVIYRRSTGWTPDDVMDIEVGVEVPAPLAAKGDVVALETPGGRVASTVHLGAYDGLSAAARAMHAWIAANGHAYGGVDWERYGEHDPDPAKLSTEVFFLLKDPAQ